MYISRQAGSMDDDGIQTRLAVHLVESIAGVDEKIGTFKVPSECKRGSPEGVDFNLRTSRHIIRDLV